MCMGVYSCVYVEVDRCMAVQMWICIWVCACMYTGVHGCMSVCSCVSALGEWRKGGEISHCDFLLSS